MAVAYQAAGSIVVSSTVASINVVAPATAVNDIMLCLLFGKDNIDHTGNAGFTELGTQNHNGTGETASIWWRRAQAGDSGATFAFTKATDNNIFFAGVIVTFRGALTSGNPFTNPGTPTTSDNASSDTVTYATFDPGIACHVVAVGFYNNDLTTVGTISGTNPTLTNRVDIETSTGADCSFFVFSGDSDGAATGARSHTTTSTNDATNQGWLFGIEAQGATTTPISISVSNVGVVAVSKVSTRFRALAVVNVGVAALTKALLFSQTVAVANVGVAGLSKVATYVRSLAVVNVGVVTLSRTASYFRTLAVSNVGVAVLQSAALFSLTLGTVSVGVVSLAKVFISGSGTSSSSLTGRIFLMRCFLVAVLTALVWRIT